MWTLNLSTLLLTLSATLRGPGASLNVLVSFNTVLYMLPISSSTSSELMSVNGPWKAGIMKTVYALTMHVKGNICELKNLGFWKNQGTSRSSLWEENKIMLRQKITCCGHRFSFMTGRWPFVPFLFKIKPLSSIVCTLSRLCSARNWNNSGTKSKILQLSA